MTHRMFRAARLGLLAVLMAGAAAAGAAEPKRGGTLSAAVFPEPVILTAAVNTAAPTGVVSGNVFDGLVDYDFDLNPRPVLAERWELSPDGRRLTFHLRRGVRWHDGVPFTSADVRYSMLEVWKKIHPRNQTTFAAVEDVETPDDHTAVFRLGAPSPAILSSLNSNGAQILPRHLYEGTDVLANPRNNAPVGTGPFVFKEWERGSHITLERNPDYWDAGKPYLDRIVFRFIQDASARAAALETGQIQYAAFNPVPLKDVGRLARLPSVTVETRGYEWLSPWLFFDLNTRHPILKDVRVRRAIAHAIDRSVIARTVWLGFGTVATGPVPSSLKRFHTDEVTGYAFDPAKAEALLDEAGHPRGPDGVRFRLTHDYMPYGDDYRRTGDYLKQALRKIGIDVSLRSQDVAAFTKRIYGDADFDISSSWFASFPDPQIGITRVYWSGSLGKGAPWTNGSGYRNPEVDELFAKAQNEPDAGVRFQHYKRFQQIVMDDLPTIPLIEVKFFTVHAAGLVDAVTSADSMYNSLKGAWFAD